MAEQGREAVAAIEEIFRTTPSRHPTRMSATVWLYVAAGPEMVWSEGLPVFLGEPAEADLPALAWVDGFGQGGPAYTASLIGAIDALLPSKNDALAALHPSDLAVPGDFPALRLPLGAPDSHLAGAIIACRLLTERCANSVRDPAGAVPGAALRRLAGGARIAADIAVSRGANAAVIEAAKRILALTGHTPPPESAGGFDDPTLS